MDSLHTPQMVAKDVKSYLYQLDLEDEDLSDLEAYASPILDAKYKRVSIGDLIEEHCPQSETQNGDCQPLQHLKRMVQ